MLWENYPRSRNRHRENLCHEGSKEEITVKTEQSAKYFHRTLSPVIVPTSVHHSNNIHIPDGQKNLPHPRTLPRRVTLQPSDDKGEVILVAVQVLYSSSYSRPPLYALAWGGLSRFKA